MRITDDFELDHRLYHDLMRIHAQLDAAGDLHPPDVLQGYCETFRQRFGPEVLRRRDGEELLSLLHEKYTGMNYWLEFKEDDEFPTSLFGTISGGSALKFGFYRRRETDTWMTGSPANQRPITTREAVDMACSYRDQLVAASEQLEALPPSGSAEDYEALQRNLIQVAPKIQNTVWAHKYLSLIHPHKLESIHALRHQRWHLVKLLQVPSSEDGRYVNASRIVALGHAFDWHPIHVVKVLYRRHGSARSYWRVGTSTGDGRASYWDRMREGSIVAIGWPQLGELPVNRSDSQLRDVLRERLASRYPADPRAVGRLASQITRFCKTFRKGDCVLASDGANTLAIGRVIGPYQYSVSEEFPHERPVEWLSIGTWRLPRPRGLRMTVYQYRADDYDNLIAVERRLLDSPVVSNGSGGEPPQTRRKWSKGGTIGRIQDILDRKGQAILYGPPGTGKTYWAELAVRNLGSLWNYGISFEELSDEQREQATGHRDDAFVRACTFHPGYGYEDFIEGYRPTDSDGQLRFALCDGIFKTLCAVASTNPMARYYLIVDEINRGDIPRIFGELLTLLDKPKRGSSALLPLSGDRFAVPENVFVVGTMNTADRSIALLDTALRRRFGFVELMPDPGVLRDTVVEGINLGPWLDGLNQKVVTHVGRDGRNLQVGHAYLMSGGRPIREFRQLARVLQEDVLPLLEEYCYDEWDKLESILGSGLVDIANRRFRAALFEPSHQAELVQAVLAVAPDASTSAIDGTTDVQGTSDATGGDNEEEDGER